MRLTSTEINMLLKALRVLQEYDTTTDPDDVEIIERKLMDHLFGD